MRWTHGNVALTVLASGTIAFFSGRWSARPSRGDCPEMAGVDAALASLDERALEARLREGALLPPSTTEKHIAALRAAVEGVDPERRACSHRVALARAVKGQDVARRTTPSLWGLSHPSEELRGLFLAEPLTRGWSKADRLDVLAQLDETTIARLADTSAADLEHWRRHYYGLLVACELADGALQRLGAARPPDCPRFAPRRPAAP